MSNMSGSANRSLRNRDANTKHVTTPTRHKPYPAYKDSGVEWLGEIPKHWKVRRLKTLASVELSNVDKKSIEGQIAVELCNYTDVYYNEHITADLEFMAATASSEQVRRFSLRSGDVLITKDSESWTDIAVPAVVMEDLPRVLCGYHLAHIRPRAGIFGPFLSRSFAAVGPKDQFELAANGITRFGLGGDAIRTGLFAVPPESEQRAIASFLDRETAQIDQLVAKKERLIELLQEQRATLITRAVTKGLEQGAAMKSSGLEWLGKVPANWQVMRVRALLNQIEQGWSPDCENREAGDDEWGVLKAGCVNRGVFLASEHKTLPAGLEPIPELEVREGDLLMSRASGSRDLVGSVALVPRCRARLLLCDKLFRLRLAPTMSHRPFVAYSLNSRITRWQIEILLSGGSGLANNIAQDVVKNLLIVLPSPEEQRVVTAFLDRETARIDALIAKVRKAAEQLQELRVTLIWAAVTGRIDVREEVR